MSPMDERHGARSRQTKTKWCTEQSYACYQRASQGCMSNVFAKACKKCLPHNFKTFPLPCLIGVPVFSKATWHRVFLDLSVCFAPCFPEVCQLEPACGALVVLFYLHGALETTPLCMPALLFRHPATKE